MITSQEKRMITIILKRHDLWYDKNIEKVIISMEEIVKHIKEKKTDNDKLIIDLIDRLFELDEDKNDNLSEFDERLKYGKIRDKLNEKKE